MKDLLLAMLKPDPVSPTPPAPARGGGRAAMGENTASFRRNLDETIGSSPQSRHDDRSARSDRAESDRASRQDRARADEARVRRHEKAAGRDEVGTGDTPRDREDAAAEASEAGTPDAVPSNSQPGNDQYAAASAGEQDDEVILVEADAGTLTGSVTAAVDADAVVIRPGETAAPAGGAVEDDPFLSIDDILGETGTDTPSTHVDAAAATASPGPAATTATAATAADTPDAADGVPQIPSTTDQHKAGPRTPAGIAADAGKPRDGNGSEGGNDNTATRPGRSADHASERALATRAAFRAQAAGQPVRSGWDGTSFADRLGATQLIDTVAADPRGQGNTGQTVTLRITPVSAESRLSAVPVNTLAFHIARSVDKGVNRFEIRLDPPELGRVDVRLEVDGESRVRIHLTVQRPEALDFLQRDARALERALDSAGLNTDGETVSFSLDPGSQGTGDDPGATFGDGEPAGTRTFGDAEEPEVLPPITHYVSSTGVDIRI